MTHPDDSLKVTTLRIYQRMSHGKIYPIVDFLPWSISKLKIIFELFKIAEIKFIFEVHLNAQI